MLADHGVLPKRGIDREHGRPRGSERLASHPCLLAMGLLAMGLLAGCSGRGRAPTYEVTGTVKLPDGTPLAGGRIMFRPAGDSDVTFAARGEIREDGTFELSTFGLGDGAVAGKHKVMVLPPTPDELMDNPRANVGPRLFIDLSYQSLRTTPLEYRVADDGTVNHFEIVVEPPKRKKRR